MRSNNSARCKQITVLLTLENNTLFGNVADLCSASAAYVYRKVMLYDVRSHNIVYVQIETCKHAFVAMCIYTPMDQLILGQTISKLQWLEACMHKEQQKSKYLYTAGFSQ